MPVRFRSLAFLALGFLCFGQPRLTQAQAPAPPPTHCLLLPVDPATRASRATLIVEGEVLDARSFWDAGHRRLFTRHRLRPFSVLKGALADTVALTLVTEGGQLGLDQQELTNTLRLTPGEQGVFFLVPAPWAGLGANPGWTAYASEQGFVRYDAATGTAAEPFRSYPAIDADFYAAMSAGNSAARRVLQANPGLGGASIGRRGQAASISSISPTTLTAGTGAVLRITGSGFGTEQGSGVVEFPNADDGGATFTKARPEDYLSWTDTRIEVRVPSNSGDSHPAGSGTVRVNLGGGMLALSPMRLTIVYALTNVQSSSGQVLDRPNHVARNASRGLSFQLESSFRGSTAAAAWRRALSTWRCRTGINWDEDPAGSASPGAADDNINNVGFDQVSAPLPDQVLGRTTSYYKGCYDATGTVVFYVEEIDMQFSNSANFQYGPLPAVGAQLDFESVALHELGHAQQLAHLIRPGAVMHYSIQRGQNTRQLETNSDVAGGRLVLRSRSFVNRGCAGPPMLPAPLTGLSTAVEAGAVALSWTTREECFLSEFVVERSLSADTTSWQALSAVATSGRLNASQQYRFTDSAPGSGLRYYRLRLRRPDGSLDSAAPIGLSADALGNEPQLFPNPVSGDQLQLTLPSTSTTTLTFELYDEIGRYYRANTASVQPGPNVLAVRIAGLPPGFYLLRWRTAEGQQGSRKLVRL